MLINAAKSDLDVGATQKARLSKFIAVVEFVAVKAFERHKDQLGSAGRC